MDTDTASPLQTLVDLAKKDVLLANFVDARCVEIIEVELPKLAFVLQDGRAMRMDERVLIADTVAHALDYREAQNTADAVSAEVREIAIKLAVVLDEGLAVVLKGEELLDRGLHFDLLSSHAEIISAFTGIKLNDKQKAIIAAEASDAEVAAAVASESDESDTAS